MFADMLGRRLVYASDEYYLLAGRPFPALDAYDGCVQHENGIGMARTFESEVRAALAGDDQLAPTGPRSGFFASVDGAPADGYRAPKTLPRSGPSPTEHGDGHDRVTVITGELGARVLEPLLDELPGNVRLLAVKNSFFGGNIGVTGLLTGTDLTAALASEPEHDRYLLPDVALSRGLFLDGTSVADLPRTVEIVATNGAALVRALQRQSA
jgi:NifB/MoaA-like Fe-S oxidoreductase